MRLCPGRFNGVELRHAMVVRLLGDVGLSGGPHKDTSGNSESAGRAPSDARGSHWYELAAGHSVLEFRPGTAAGRLLSLHVLIDCEDDAAVARCATIAWWETGNGMWVAEIGSA